MTSGRFGTPMRYRPQCALTVHNETKVFHQCCLIKVEGAPHERRAILFPTFYRHLSQQPITHCQSTTYPVTVNPVICHIMSHSTLRKSPINRACDTSVTVKKPQPSHSNPLTVNKLSCHVTGDGTFSKNNFTVYHLLRCHLLQCKRWHIGRQHTVFCDIESNG